MNIKNNSPLIIVLVVFLAAGYLIYIGYSNIKMTHQKTTEIINSQQKKHRLFTTMYSAARERTTILSKMLGETDVFELDDLRQQMGEQARVFLIARQQLLALNLNERELKLLDAQIMAARENTPIIDHVAELFGEEKRDEAMKLFFDEAIPGQNIVLENLDLTIMGLNKESSNSIERINQDFEDNIRIISLLSILLAIAATVVITTVMTRLSRRDEIRLKNALSEAEYANESKSQFLASMSHELRTPMNVVLGFSELLVEDCSKPEHVQHAKLIHKAGTHLLELINDVLDLSKIEAGKLELKPEKFHLHSILSDCSKLLLQQASDNNIELRYHKDKCNATCFADAKCLKQCVLNLMSNAIKYNQPGGFVDVQCQFQENGKLRILIKDNGTGIPEGMKDKLFDPFNRLGAEAGTIQGSGIGLSITKKMIEQMGGQIGFESKAGEGSEFWLEIQASPQSSLETTVNYDIAKSGNYEALQRPHNLLYIEDNADNMLLMERIVTRNTRSILLKATDAESGIEIAVSQQPDLIMLDINLPGMDGYETLAHLKITTETRHIPVIAVSANAMQADIDKAMEKGFDAYITKPIRIDGLMNALSEHIKF